MIPLNKRAMSLPAHMPFFDAQAYLAWETKQAGKHEYHDGEVFAMARAAEAHVTVALNVAMALRNHLRGSPCSLFISDMKLFVEEDNAFSTPTSSSPAPAVTAAHDSFLHSHFTKIQTP